MSKIKLCPKCKVVKPLGSFRLRYNKNRSIQSWCKNCEYLNRKDYMRKYLADYHLKQKYGLSWEELVELFNKQEGKCGICRTKITIEKRHIDHDHKTNKIRGLLCHNCNHGLGHFKDKEEFLEKAVEYLKVGRL